MSIDPTQPGPTAERIAERSHDYMAGDLLVIETGEYSDGSWAGPVRLLRSFNKRDVAEAYVVDFKPG